MSTPSVFLSDADCTLWHGDALEVVLDMPSESVDCIVTSPPYWGLRDYGQEGQYGLEPTPEHYCNRMVNLFRELRRVLATHGTCWVNLGDSYAGVTDSGLKAKDLVGMPWRVALALQADGWWLRSDIIWSKPNPMPEAVTDRPTKAHEYVFLLANQPKYFFDVEPIRERQTSADNRDLPGSRSGVSRPDYEAIRPDGPLTRERIPMRNREWNPSGRNSRTVWEIATQPYPEAHFATFPEELARRCIAAGCPEQVCRVCGKARERITSHEYEFTQKTHARSKHSKATHRVDRSALMGVPANKIVTTEGFTDCDCKVWDEDNQLAPKYRPGIVLDPFMGSGTVAFVARKLGRHSIGIDLSAEYLALAARRLAQQSLFADAHAPEPQVAHAGSEASLDG